MENRSHSTQFRFTYIIVLFVENIYSKAVQWAGVVVKSRADWYSNYTTKILIS